MTTTISLTINGTVYRMTPGISVLAALADAGVAVTRTSVTGAPRAPLCGMGVCFECRASINGRRHTRTCMIMVEDGMEVTIHDD